MGHETFWSTQHVSTTAPPRGGASAARPERARGSPPSAGVGELGGAVASGLAARRRGRARPQAGPWGAAPIDRPAVPPIGATLAEGGPGAWLSQRAVDLEAYRRRDTDPLRGARSPRACL